MWAMYLIINSPFEEYTDKGIYNSHNVRTCLFPPLNVYIIIATKICLCKCLDIWLDYINLFTLYLL